MSASDVEGLELQLSTRFLLAANGTPIWVLGDVSVSLRIWRCSAIITRFLVSDQVSEPLLRMKGLREHRCPLGFGNGVLFAGRS